MTRAGEKRSSSWSGGSKRQVLTGRRHAYLACREDHVTPAACIPPLPVICDAAGKWGAISQT